MRSERRIRREVVGWPRHLGRPERLGGGNGAQTERLYRCPNCGEKTIPFRGRFFASRMRPAHCTSCRTYFATKQRFLAGVFGVCAGFVTLPVALVLAGLSIWAFLGAILLYVAVAVFVAQATSRLVPVSPVKARWWNKPLWGKRDSGSPPPP